MYTGEKPHQLQHLNDKLSGSISRHSSTAEMAATGIPIPFPTFALLFHLFLCWHWYTHNALRSWFNEPNWQKPPSHL